MDLYAMSPVVLALLCGFFTWGMTAAGSALVFIFKSMKQQTLNVMMGFASGVMTAASFWSLLLPALELCEARGDPHPWFPVVAGFGAGGLFLYLIGRILPHQHHIDGQPHGLPSSLRRNMLLILAITLHNIPEGLSYGVAIGNSQSSPELLPGAVILAIAIGIQNFPEGAAVSIPLRRDGMSRMKSFMYGQLSGVFEPIAAVVGVFLAIAVGPLLPYALSFAAGAMIYVVFEELIPESQTNSHLYGGGATAGGMLGFMLMTFLDVALG